MAFHCSTYDMVCPLLRWFRCLKDTLLALQSLSPPFRTPWLISPVGRDTLGVARTDALSVLGHPIHEIPIYYEH